MSGSPFEVVVVEKRLLLDAWEAWRDLSGHEAAGSGSQRGRRIERTTAFLRAVAEGRPPPPGLFSDKK